MLHLALEFTVPSAPSECSASPISIEVEEANEEPVREEVLEAREGAMSEELLAIRRRLAELGDKAVLEEPVEALEIEVVDLPDRKRDGDHLLPHLI